MELKTLVIQARGSIKAAEFARKLGVTRQAVYQWEQGKREPSSEMLEKMGIERQFVLTGEAASSETSKPIERAIIDTLPRREHNPKTCRLYGCLQCKLHKEKDL